MKVNKAVAVIRSVALYVVASLIAGNFCAPPVAADAPVQPPCLNCIHHDGSADGLLQKGIAGTPSPDPTASGVSPTLRAGTDNTLLRTGTDSTTLQVGTQNTMIRAGVEHEAVPLNILILIDCSQSMKEGLGGPLSGEHEEKMNAAKMVLEQTMSQIPPEVNVGLRVFGQSFHNDPYIDCQQTALLVPIGNHNRRAIIERVRQVRPFGLTPLTYALREAANDLSQVQGHKQIILISDGAETCGFDPCSEVRRISASGVNMKIDIVGLGLKRDWEAKQQLNCIASQTGGKFYDANTAAELIDSIRNSVKQALGEANVTGKVLTKVKPSVAPAFDDKGLPADLK